MIELLGFYEPFSSWSHLLTALAAFIGAFFLCTKGRGNGSRIFSLVLYSFSLVFLFSMSGVYHLLSQGLARDVLQRLDYAGIWVLIAGTFTPIHMILFRGAWRWGILLAVWVIAITGLTLQVIFFESFPHWLSVTLFLGLGWMGILTAYKFRTTFREHSMKPLALGGLFYSVGALVDAFNTPTLWNGVVGPHEIFHVFVILGAYCHWYFIYEWSDHPVANSLIFHVSIDPENRCTAFAYGEHIPIEAETVESLKALIQERVNRKYRGQTKPTIYLRYFKEEKI